MTGDVGWQDVFVRDRQLATTTIATVDSNGALGGTVEVSVKPAELDFGEVPVSTTATRSLWLRNKADTPFEITKISLRGTHVAQFRLASTCASTLAPGTSCAIRVTFAPTSSGLKSAKVRVDAGGKVRINPVAGLGLR